MIIATLIPLYLASTMSLDILRQKNKHDDFIKDYSKLSSKKVDEIKSRTAEYESKLDGENKSVDPFAQEGYEVDYNISDDLDAVFAYITVPLIDVSQPIYLGATEEHLVSGFAHVDGTSLPIGGLGKRAVIAGHRGGYYGRLDLLNAHKIQKGDLLKIDLGYEILTYRMVSREIIKPSEWEKLKPIVGQDIVTLLTCDPFPTAQNRMLVNFQRVEESSDGPKSLEKNRADFFQTEQNSVNTMKYGLLIASVLLFLILLILIVKLFKLIIRK